MCTNLDLSGCHPRESRVRGNPHARFGGGQTEKEQMPPRRLATLLSKYQFAPSNVAGVIRLFPPSSKDFAASRKAIVVQITTVFPSAPQMQSAFCPGVTGFHLLYFYASVRKCSPVLDAQLVPSVPDIE